ncbi:PLP-dependent aminotransferase family protein [uncultured Roseibium sp.]|uniref:aminotransferase-like domain-containing protein n=1 Tax=uncultured Roseibium sp. TaxID=1936171 RepID=UPI003217C1DF
MTNWVPDIPAGKGPMYARLASRIADDIVTGALPVGAKLPPQRDLAYDLGITVGTVGRAYALVREQGLVSGEVGRGTYVLGSTPDTDVTEIQPAMPGTAAPVGNAAAWTQTATSTTDSGFAGTRVAIPAPDAIRFDSTSAPELGQADVIKDLTAQIMSDSPYEIASYSRTVPDTWRAAGRQWLTRSNWQPPEATIVPTTGAHAAALAIIAATTTPGDRVVFEELTYSAIARGAALSGRHVVQVPRDDEGPLPDELAKICAQKHPKVLFLTPTMHNPTLGTMSEGRREKILALAHQHNLWLIEDEVFGSLRETALTPFAALAPERTFHVGSLSKSVTAGIRGAWVSCPPSHAQRVHTTHKMLSGGISFLLAEVSARLVLSGAADMFRRRALSEIAARHELVCKYLQGYEMNSAPDAPFIWLKLPSPWLASNFKAAAASAHVLIDDEDEFKPARTGNIHHRVRIGFSNAHSGEETGQALGIIRQLLEDSGACYDSFE